MRLVTPRLILRPWRDADRAPFAAMSADAAMMQFLLPIADRAAADAWIDRQLAHWARHGFGYCAVEIAATGEFAGSMGLLHVPYEAHFTPAVELGWRIARPFWGRGYATEAAAAALRHGFDALHLEQLVANASVDNVRSRRVMHKLGMTHDPADDFDHPHLPESNPARRQVLYRVNAVTAPRALPG